MKSHLKIYGMAFGLAVALAAPASATDLKFMTGPQGGSWIPLGGQLKDAWEKAIPGLNVQAVPGAGMANVRAVEEGKSDIGFGNSITTVDAVEGKPPFTKPHKNVCNVATLYPQYYQLVVPADAGINSVKDPRARASARSRKATPASSSPSSSCRSTASAMTT
jgi:TRAP transporter TAXI family solute receptor